MDWFFSMGESIILGNQLYWSLLLTGCILSSCRWQIDLKQRRPMLLGPCMASIPNIMTMIFMWTCHVPCEHAWGQSLRDIHWRGIISSLLLNTSFAACALWWVLYFLLGLSTFFCHRIFSFWLSYLPLPRSLNHPIYVIYSPSYWPRYIHVHWLNFF